MPMYEYLCDSCHHRFDIKQKFTDESLTICPNCGQRIHRVIQPAKVVFKGSGFYVTDHKGSSAVLDSSKADAKSDGKSSNDAEAKPAAEKAAKTESTASSASSVVESNGSSAPAPAPAPSSASAPASS